MSTTNCILPATSSNSTPSPEATEPAGLSGSRSAESFQFGTLMDHALARNSGRDSGPADAPAPKTKPDAGPEETSAPTGENTVARADSPRTSEGQNWRPNLGDKGNTLHWLHSYPADVANVPAPAPANDSQPAPSPTLPKGENADGGSSPESASGDGTASSGTETGTGKHASTQAGNGNAAELLVAAMATGWIAPVAPNPTPVVKTPKNTETAGGTEAPTPAAPATGSFTSGSVLQAGQTTRSGRIASRSPSNIRPASAQTAVPATVSLPRQPSPHGTASLQRSLPVALAASPENVDATPAITPNPTGTLSNRPTMVTIVASTDLPHMDSTTAFSSRNNSFFQPAMPAAVAARAPATSAQQTDIPAPAGHTTKPPFDDVKVNSATSSNSSANKTSGPVSVTISPLPNLSMKADGTTPVAVTSKVLEPSAEDSPAMPSTAGNTANAETGNTSPSPANPATAKQPSAPQLGDFETATAVKTSANTLGTADSAKTVTQTIVAASNPDATTAAASSASDTPQQIDAEMIAETANRPANMATVAGSATGNIVPAKLKSGIIAPNSPQIEAEAPAGEGSELHGTSVAKQYATMKNPDKASNVAGPAEQELPGKTGTAPRQDVPPSVPLIKALPDHLEAANSISNASTSSPSVAANTGVPIISLPVTDLRINALERTHDMVALHALRLSNTNSDSLHVVIKPGAGIQLSLELRQKADGIEVQAQLHRGDMEFFRQHWTELQDRLEPRGVRLADLTCSDNFVGTNAGGFAQPQQQQPANEDPLFAGAFAEFAMADFKGAPAEQRAAQAAAYRGWETWA